MASARPAQVNIRSDPARQRLDELVRATGMAATTIVELALASYVPPPLAVDELPPGMKRVGKLLVLTGGPLLTVEDVNASIEETRNGIRD